MNEKKRYPVDEKDDINEEEKKEIKDEIEGIEKIIKPENPYFESESMDEEEKRPNGLGRKVFRFITRIKEEVFRWMDDKLASTGKFGDGAGRRAILKGFVHYLEEKIRDVLSKLFGKIKLNISLDSFESAFRDLDRHIKDFISSLISEHAPFLSPYTHLIKILIDYLYDLITKYIPGIIEWFRNRLRRRPEIYG